MEVHKINFYKLQRKMIPYKRTIKFRSCSWINKNMQKFLFVSVILQVNLAWPLSAQSLSFLAIYLPGIIFHYTLDFSFRYLCLIKEKQLVLPIIPKTFHVIALNSLIVPNNKTCTNSRSWLPFVFNFLLDHQDIDFISPLILYFLAITKVVPCR